MIDLNYQQYQGYYISNARFFIHEFDPNKPYLIRPDVRTFSYGGSFMFFFNNDKFSYRAPYVQNEWQKKSAGTFLIGNYLFINTIIGDSSLIPSSAKDHFSEKVDIKSASLIHDGVAAGYAYTLVVRKFFFVNLSLFSGIAVSSFSKSDSYWNFTEYQSVLSNRTQVRFAAGYNNRRFYAGFSTVADRFFMPANITGIKQNYGNIRLYLGTRFNVSKKVKS